VPFWQNTRDVELRREVTLLRGSLEPSRRVLDAPWHALAAGEQRAQGKLGLGLAGIGGRPVPERRLHLTGCGTATPMCMRARASMEAA